MVAMFDSVNLDEIPPDAPAVAGYIGGKWPTFTKLAARWPNAYRLSVAVSARYDADCLDIEPGDATPWDAPAWVRRQQRRGINRPWVYTSVAGAQPLLNILSSAGVPRAALRLWTAHYTHRPHLCGPPCGYSLQVNADATQWTDKSLGRNLDESLVADDVFTCPPCPGPITEVPLASLNTQFFPLPPLNTGGEGWMQVDISFDKIAGTVPQGSNPDRDGTLYETIDIQAQPNGNGTMFSFRRLTSGHPVGGMFVKWVEG